MTSCVFFDRQAFRAREDARIAAINAWKASHPPFGDAWPAELVQLSASFFPPGSMWECPWYHDPADPEDLAGIDEMIRKMEAEPGRSWHLSIHYMRDWARIRPPIEVICPGGMGWCVDAKSSNGTGWTVTGTAPRLTASPSIWVGQGKGGPREYHGWLRDGVFYPA